MEKTRFLFRLPKFKELEEHRLAVLLNRILLLILTGMVIAFIFMPQKQTLYINIGLIIVVVLCKWLLQLSQLWAAKYVFSFGMLLTFVVNVWQFNGLDDFVAIASVLIIFIFGALIDRRAMLYVAISLCIFLIVVFILFDAQILHSVLPPLTSFENLIFFVIILMSTSGVLYYVLRDRDRALRIAKDELLLHRNAQKRITAQSVILDLLHTVRTLIAHELDIDGICAKVVEAVHTSLGYPKVSIYLFNETKGVLELKHQRGLNTIDFELKIGPGLISKSFVEDRVLLVENVKADTVFFGDSDSVSEICVPISYAGKVIGVINLESVDRILTEDDVQLMTSLGEYVNVAVARIFLYEEQQQSEMQFQMLFNQTNDGVFLFDLDNNYLAINSRGAEMLGYSHEEIMERNAADFVVPAEYDDGLEKIGMLLAGKQLPVYERTFIRKGGATFSAEINLSLIRDVDGTPFYFQSIVRDVSERKEFELQLLYERNLLQSLIDAVPLGIYAKDRESKFMIANKLVLDAWGIEKMENLLGTLDTDYLDADYAKETRDEEVKIMSAGKALLDKEEMYINEQGEEITTLTSKAPLFDKEDSIIGIVGITADISRLKRAETVTKKLNEELEVRVRERTEKLQEANQDLESFAYTVSHDLRAPLRAIDGFTSILNEKIADSITPESQTYLDKIHVSIKQMAALIDGLLNFSRLGRLELSMHQTDLTSIVQNVWDGLAHERRERELSIKFTVSDLGESVCDPVLIHQVFLNLLSNAIKFTYRVESTVISVGVEEKNGERVYFVMDNGIGFDIKYEDKLFGVFERLHTTEEFEGTGVGLAIVKKIIQRHGGQIWTDAEEGRGAIFFFTLANEVTEVNHD